MKVIGIREGITETTEEYLDQQDHMAAELDNCRYYCDDNPALEVCDIDEKSNEEYTVKSECEYCLTRPCVWSENKESMQELAATTDKYGDEDAVETH